MPVEKEEPCAAAGFTRGWMFCDTAALLLVDRVYQEQMVAGALLRNRRLKLAITHICRVQAWALC